MKTTGKNRINLRFKDPHLLKRLSEEAKRNNRSCNSEILHLLTRYLQSSPPQSG